MTIEEQAIEIMCGLFSMSLLVNKFLDLEEDLLVMDNIGWAKTLNNPSLICCPLYKFP